jgi:hypothetical protein
LSKPHHIPRTFRLAVLAVEKVEDFWDEEVIIHFRKR